MCHPRYNLAPSGKRIVKVRITEAEDPTTQEGLQYIFDVIERFKEVPIFLWGSLPCTAGCTFQRQNKFLYPKTHDAKLAAHMQLFHKLIDAFMFVAYYLREQAPIHRIMFEWPQINDLWAQSKVKEMIKLFKLKRVTFNGCRLGLVSPEGAPLLKPWAVETNCPGCRSLSPLQDWSLYWISKKTVSNHPMQIFGI